MKDKIFGISVLTIVIAIAAYFIGASSFGSYGKTLLGKVGVGS
jgi:hypothetical protein